jgi:hypothetical protein
MLPFFFRVWSLLVVGCMEDPRCYLLLTIRTVVPTGHSRSHGKLGNSPWELRDGLVSSAMGDVSVLTSIKIIECDYLFSMF